MNPLRDLVKGQEEEETIHSEGGEMVRKGIKDNNKKMLLNLRHFLSVLIYYDPCVLLCVILSITYMLCFCLWC